MIGTIHAYAKTPSQTKEHMFLKPDFPSSRARLGILGLFEKIMMRIQV